MFLFKILIFLDYWKGRFLTYCSVVRTDIRYLPSHFFVYELFSILNCFFIILLFFNIFSSFYIFNIISTWYPGGLFGPSLVFLVLVFLYFLVLFSSGIMFFLWFSFDSVLILLGVFWFFLCVFVCLILV